MIPRRQLLGLSIAAVVILALGVWIGTRSQKTAPSEAVGAKVLPSLVGKTNDVNEIRIVKAGDKPVATLKRMGGAEQKDSWRVVERDNYPADFTKVRELLVKLSELEIVEEKTAKPDNYPALGVEDVKSDKATGKRIELKGIEPALALIVGKSASHTGNYVRVIGQDRSVQAKPQLSVQDEPSGWLDRSVLDFPEDRVQEVRLTNIAPSEPIGDKAKKKPVARVNYQVTREHRDQKDFTVAPLPKGKKLSSPGTASSIPGALANLTFDDVRAAAKDDTWSKTAEVSTAEYRFFDGTVITAKGRKSDDKYWVRFAAGFDEAQNKRFQPKPAADAAKADKKDGPSAAGAFPNIVPGADSAAKEQGKSPESLREEARKLNERLQSWVYELSSYKYETLFKPLDELLQK